VTQETFSPWLRDTRPEWNAAVHTWLADFEQALWVALPAKNLQVRLILGHERPKKCPVSLFGVQILIFLVWWIMLNNEKRPRFLE
jgi:hypothetical protein